MNHSHRTQVLTVLSNPHAKHYIVVKRNVAPYEPGFVVVQEGSGSAANAIAHFFDQIDAIEYCEFRNKKKKELKAL